MYCLLKDFFVNVHLVQAFLFDNMLTLHDALEVDSNTMIGCQVAKNAVGPIFPPPLKEPFRWIHVKNFGLNVLDPTTFITSDLMSYMIISCRGKCSDNVVFVDGTKHAKLFVLFQVMDCVGKFPSSGTRTGKVDACDWFGNCIIIFTCQIERTDGTKCRAEGMPCDVKFVIRVFCKDSLRICQNLIPLAGSCGIFFYGFVEDVAYFRFKKLLVSCCKRYRLVIKVL